MKFTIGLVLTFLLLVNDLSAQKLTREQVEDTISKIPAFSMYRDNYFISGIPLHRAISKETADAKYQISFRQLLTRQTLPLDSYLFLTYTQKAFWNVYKFSSPFREINFNPGIQLGIPVFDSRDELTGMAFVKAEHHSNGRDSVYSRSWNKIALSFHARLFPGTVIALEGWLPFRYKKDNPDLLEYLGYGEVNLLHDIKPDKISIELMLQKSWEGEAKGAMRLRLLYRPFEIRNLYLMAEWYNGYGESLISYDEFQNMIRVGFVLRSDELNFLKSAPAAAKAAK
jgi:phospholipase A1